MAQIAKSIRKNARLMLINENLGGFLKNLDAYSNNIKKGQIKSEKLADIFTQTLVYGFFSAKIAQGIGYNLEDVLRVMPDVNPLLRETLNGNLPAQTREELGLVELKEALSENNVDAILEEFRNDGVKDPIIHFYELFLKEYDPSQKIKRGIFFTPNHVVSFIVRAVDYLLQTELGLNGGLADNVSIIDPAVGTGTFLKRVIEEIKKKHEEKNGELEHEELENAWNRYVRMDLMHRLFGFELILAPCMAAHLKIGLKLTQTGFKFNPKDKINIFQANSLDKNEIEEIILNSSKNGQAMVVIGNPPYSGFPSNTGKWITDLVHDYYLVDGERLEEKNPKWLLDDYVKFIRFGQWCINKAECGILAFITPHGYLDNPTFRGMRQSLINDFPIIYICDLHGNLIKREKAPDGSRDENIFDIKQGVCIGIFMKPEKRMTRNSIYHHEVWGSREHKFSWLEQNNINTINWKKLSPTSPFHLFVPQNRDLWTEYAIGLKLTDIFKIYSAGIATARDHFTIQWTKDRMLETLKDFIKLTPEEARKKYDLRRDVRDWKVKLARQDIIESNVDPNLIVPISYRPFDVRYTYYTGKSRGFLCMPRPEVMQNMLRGENIGFCVSRSVRGAPWRDVFASRYITEFGLIATRPGNTAPLFPLYVFEKQDEATTCKSNLTELAISNFSKKLGLKFIGLESGDLKNTFGTRDVFHYIYAILHSQSYRNRYAEFLKIDFPRIPITENKILFKILTQFGADLVALHVLNDKYEGSSWNETGKESPFQAERVKFVEGSNGREVGRFNGECFENGKLFIDLRFKNGSCFTGISQEVWKFHVGSYQVCYKWLYDKRARKTKNGKILTEEEIHTFKNMIISMSETIQIMKKIDKIIKNEGGWTIS